MADATPPESRDDRPGSPGPGELAGVRVLDASSDLAGAYCAKLLADAGADVVHLEAEGGDPMRRWRWHGDVPDGEDGALFRYLRHGQRSAPWDEFDDWVATAHLVLVNGGDAGGDASSSGAPDPADLAAAHPAAVVVALSPYGLHGPWAQRPATEFVVQAESGGIAVRGGPERPPIQAGGRIVVWVAGAFAAVAALAALRTSLATGRGELVDLALLDVANLTCTMYGDLFNSLQGRPDIDPARPGRSFETPSIEPTADGYVGFNTNTRDQFDAFCVLIERPDLLDDERWASLAHRVEHRVEWNEIVRAWTTRHATAEIVERAAELRIPVAPVSDPSAVAGLAQCVERGVFVAAPEGGFVLPRRPWAIDDEPRPPVRPAPAPGAHAGQTWWPDTPPMPDPASAPGDLPLTGLTVLDLTAWWAGPSSTGILAALGADVIHVESTRRMDGMRMTGGMFVSLPQWWERSAFFLSANANKRDLTLDLDQPRARELLLELVAEADVLIENFTPRVLEGFGLTWDVVRAANPRAVMVRMPAFGLTGPWRDRPGFAQTMEQVTGLAWVTGHPDDQPRIQRGPCDPNGGVHAAFATLVGLARRDRTGVGCFVEAPMFEAALAVAAEPVLEWSAYGHLVERDGNRGPEAAPQGLYPCAGPEQWLALAVATDPQWQALCRVIARPDLADDPTLVDHAGRRRAHDRIDDALRAWAAPLDLDGAVAQLVDAGVPAGRVVDNRRQVDHPQFVARRWFEEVDHPVVGRHPTPGMPFRFASVDHWIRTPAPTLGQHDREILEGRLGLDPSEVDALEAAGATGDWPQGMPR